MKSTTIMLSMFCLTILGCDRTLEVEYYDNDQIQYSVNLKNDLREGIMMLYYETGYLKGEVNYLKGRVNGTTKNYDSLGVIHSTYEYISDMKSGPFKVFHSNGNVRSVGICKQGEPDGVVLEYYPNGKLYRRYVYDFGNMIYMKGYSLEGVQYDSKLDIRISRIDSLKSVKFELGYTELDSAGIIIVLGHLDSEKNLIDTMEILGSKDLDYIYMFNPDQKNLTGVLYEMKLPEQTLEGAYFFEYEIE